MKILHINSNYLTSKLHENLIDQLEEKSISNTVFMPIKVEKEKEFLYESKHEVYSPKSFKDFDKFIFWYKQHKIFNKLISILNPQDYDLVHAHTLFTDGNVAYNLYRKYNIPYVVTVRGTTDIEVFYKKRFNLRHKGHLILKHAQKVIFLSKTSKESLLDEYISSESLKKEIIEKSHVIPNGIDSFWFENEGTPKKLETNMLKFIQVGKVEENKNVLGSIKGINNYLQKYNTEVSLTIVGEIKNTNYFDRLEEESKIKLNFIDPVHRDKLIDYYRKHDIFIMPSFKETFGLVYPEAMSQGLPVLYTKGQGFDEQFADGEVGYPVKANDSNDIAKNIKLITKNYESISSNALQLYKKYNWSIISTRYEKIYRETLDSKSNIN